MLMAAASRLRQLRWNCVNYDREVREYTNDLHKTQRAAKLDQWVKEAECQVQDFGILDMKLYKAWNGQAAPKPCQQDARAWLMDDVLIYDHCEWQLFVGSLVCPIRFCKLRVQSDIVIAMKRDGRSRPCEPWD